MQTRNISPDILPVLHGLRRAAHILLAIRTTLKTRMLRSSYSVLQAFPSIVPIVTSNMMSLTERKTFSIPT